MIQTSTSRRSRRPWWVLPGSGALLGALAIALAAQSSLTGSPVAMPVGPRLPMTGMSVHRSGTTPPAVTDTVVAPNRPVVTETGAIVPPATAWTAAQATPSGGTPADVAAAGSPAPTGSVRPATGDPGPTTTTTTEAAPPTTTTSTTTTTTTTVPPTTTTTTRPKRERGDD